MDGIIRMVKPQKITKEIKQVTGSAEGITFTKENKKILKVKKGDLVEVKKAE